MSYLVAVAPLSQDRFDMYKKSVYIHILQLGIPVTLGALLPTILYLICHQIHFFPS